MLPLPSMTQSRVPPQVHYGKHCSQIALSLLLCSSNVPFSNSVTPHCTGHTRDEPDLSSEPVTPNLSQVLGHQSSPRSHFPYLIVAHTRSTIPLCRGTGNQVDNSLTPVLPNNLSQVLGAPIQSQITPSISDSRTHPFHHSSLQRNKQSSGVQSEAYAWLYSR